MSRVKVSLNWLQAMDSAILQGKEITVTESFLPAIQALVKMLVKYGQPYKVFNAGAGVRTVTTKVDECPLCKAKVKP